jgi:hypothetical protein
MSASERLDLMEKMRQAYYGYDSNNVPRVQKIFTYYDLENDRPIFTVNEHGQRTCH